MKTLQQKAREYFEEELSGEPLTQDAVEEALVEFANTVLTQCMYCEKEIKRNEGIFICQECIK